MDEMRCGNCKHWDNSDGRPYGDCRRIPHVTSAKKELAYACDGEVLAAWLSTGAKFGCVLWEGEICEGDKFNA